jgi:hypothetical protein
MAMAQPTEMPAAWRIMAVVLIVFIAVVPPVTSYFGVWV